jgi:hypothetical protein
MPMCRRVRSLRLPRPVDAPRILLRQSQRLQTHYSGKRPGGVLQNLMELRNSAFWCPGLVAGAAASVESGS